MKSKILLLDSTTISLCLSLFDWAKYKTQKKTGIEQRIELFNSVCGAIQYAHNNLVVHRDLKPQNIWVTRDGHIKILDFRIAKLLYPHHDEFANIETRPGGRLMSLEYASPEQVSGDPKIRNNLEPVPKILSIQK